MLLKLLLKNFHLQWCGYIDLQLVILTSFYILNLCDLTLKYLHNLNMEFVICDDFNINFHKESIFNKKITLPFQSYKGF